MSALVQLIQTSLLGRLLPRKTNPLSELGQRKLVGFSELDWEAQGFPRTFRAVIND
jgi:hypothetical protein